MILIDEPKRALLTKKGIEHFNRHDFQLHPETKFEAPCGIKWTKLTGPVEMGMYSYMVKGFCCGAKIGRYTSIGEDVQIGRQDHPMNWLSTNPFQYRNGHLFSVGSEFEGAKEYKEYISPMIKRNTGKRLKMTIIGNDVWIGHGAMIKAGVTIGNGAVIAANAVVVKDVPDYAVVAGNPGIVKKYRFNPHVISQLLNLCWWDYAPWQLEGIDFSDIEHAIKGVMVLRAKKVPIFRPSVIIMRDLGT